MQRCIQLQGEFEQSRIQSAWYQFEVQIYPHSDGGYSTSRNGYGKRNTPGDNANRTTNVRGTSTRCP